MGNCGELQIEAKDNVSRSDIQCLTVRAHLVFGMVSPEEWRITITGNNKLWKG